MRRAVRPGRSGRRCGRADGRRGGRGHGAPARSFPVNSSPEARMTHDPALLPARTLAGLYARRVLSRVEALEAILARIARLNPRLNAIVALDEVGARAAARASEARWRAGTPLSP